MSRFSWLFGVFFLAGFFVLTGCNQSQQPPDEITRQGIVVTFLGKGTVFLSHFKGRYKGTTGGQSILICCDIKGNSGGPQADPSKHQRYLSRPAEGLQLGFVCQ
jgi:hypothetical protein